MRVGWILASKSICLKLKTINWVVSGGGIVSTMSHIVCSYMQLGLMQKVIDATRKNFLERAIKVDKVLQGSDSFNYDFPWWGYFFWIKLNPKVDVEKLKRLLAKNKVLVLFGDSAMDSEKKNLPQFQYLKHRMRICFVKLDIEIVLIACQVIRNCIEESMESSPKF